MSEGQDGSVAVGDGVGAGEGRQERQRMVMQLYLVRGSFFGRATTDDAAAAAGAGGSLVMNAAVWSRMPEEVIWEVLRFVPAAKLFQLQLVSRKWRQVLTSAHFWRGLTADQRERSSGGVLACVRPGPRPAPGGANDDDGQGSNLRAWEVDLSTLVPSWFWSSSESYPAVAAAHGVVCDPYSVVAAAHGLVCISNDEDVEESFAWWPGRAWPQVNRYCVLNPLTRTCVVLPRLPFKAHRWLLPSSTCVAIWGASVTAWHLATYDLAAAAAGTGGWVSAHNVKPVPNFWNNPTLWPPVGALLGGETYWYSYVGNKVQVTTAPGGPGGGGSGGHVEVGELDTPSVTLLGLDEAAVWFRDPLFLFAQRGALFFVSETVTVGKMVSMGVWRLARERMEWEGVAWLEEQEVERLVGVRCGEDDDGDGNTSTFELFDAYPVRELVCCHVQVYRHGDGAPVRLLLGFNLDTGRWEVVHGEEELMAAKTFHLRPDLFLC